MPKRQSYRLRCFLLFPFLFLQIHGFLKYVTTHIVWIFVLLHQLRVIMVLLCRELFDLAHILTFSRVDKSWFHCKILLTLLFRFFFWLLLSFLFRLLMWIFLNLLQRLTKLHLHLLRLLTIFITLVIVS